MDVSFSRALCCIERVASGLLGGLDLVRDHITYLMARGPAVGGGWTVLLVEIGSQALSHAREANLS
jgi:hypothetical protein